MNMDCTACISSSRKRGLINRGNPREQKKIPHMNNMKIFFIAKLCYDNTRSNRSTERTNQQ